MLNDINNNKEENLIKLKINNNERSKDVINNSKSGDIEVPNMVIIK